MPRRRFPKTNRNSIDEASVKQAILEYFNGTYSERRAAVVNGIKRSTLQSRVKQILKNTTKAEYLQKHRQNQDDSGNDSGSEDATKYSSKYTNRQVFTTEEEDQLENYIKKCADFNYGLTYVQVQKLAYEYASVLPHCRIPPEWHEGKQAKEGWKGVLWLGIKHCL